jgi:hypothetical protein
MMEPLFVLLTVLALPLVMAFARLLRGPSLPDRVVALDLIMTIGVAVIAVYARLSSWTWPSWWRWSASWAPSRSPATSRRGAEACARRSAPAS